MNSQSEVDLSLLSWANAFLNGRNLKSHFTHNAIWRDYLAMEWDLQTHEGWSEISKALPDEMGAKLISISSEAPNEIIFSFERKNRRIKALAELHQEKCVRLFTSLDFMPSLDSAVDAPPAVLIIGAGQSGLALAAHLRDLGVPYLVSEKNLRVGDNWRKRYSSLVLHDPVWMNHLPFKRFPDDWPTFTPKNMMGDWLEEYAETLQLNVQCNSEVTSAEFDQTQGTWSVEIRAGDVEQNMRVQHLVFAVGTSGFPKQPRIQGHENFLGRQLHSSEYRTGSDFSGQSVVIIGATNSAHDIAVDLVNHGAAPTLVQRSSTHVVPHQIYIDDILSPLYGPEHKRPLPDADFQSLAKPMRLLEQHGKAIFEKAQEEWKNFYDELSSTGFAIDFAEDGSGIIGKYRRSASGYYIDVGGSQLVIDGKIQVRTGKNVRSITADGLILDDDSTLNCDAIIYATGFGSMEEWVSRVVDEPTANKIGQCWGYGSGYRGDPAPWEGELRNMWKPTAQLGLWFMGGNLAQVRIYSRYLAMQLCESVRKLTI